MIFCTLDHSSPVPLLIPVKKLLDGPTFLPPASAAAAAAAAAEEDDPRGARLGFTFRFLAAEELPLLLLELLLFTLVPLLLLPLPLPLLLPLLLPLPLLLAGSPVLLICHKW